MAHPDNSLAFAAAQGFVILMSLDSLQGVWKDLNIGMDDFDGMMRAARQTILRTKPAPDDPHPKVAEEFLSVLANFSGDISAKTLEHWFETLDGRPHDQSLRYWNGWLSQYQHKQAIPGIDVIWTKEILPAYRRDVVIPCQVFSKHLKENVVPIPLSDWDLYIHASYRICYFSQARFENSLAFLRLEQEKGNRLSLAFLKEWSKILPPGMQTQLREEVIKGIQEREAFLGEKARMPWEKSFDPKSVLAMGEL